MNKKNLIISLFFLVISAAIADSVLAQSTLEYTSLISGVSAAASSNTKKEKAGGENQEEASNIGSSGMVTQAGQKVYSDAANMLSKSGAKLENLGNPNPSGQTDSSKTQEPNEDSNKIKIIDIDNDQPANATSEKVSSSTHANSNPFIKIYLKDGKTITGQLLEKRDDYIKIDIDGIPVSYFNEEMDRTENVTKK